MLQEHFLKILNKENINVYGNGPLFFIIGLMYYKPISRITIV